MRAPGQRSTRWRWLVPVASTVALSAPFVASSLVTPSRPAPATATAGARSVSPPSWKLDGLDGRPPTAVAHVVTASAVAVSEAPAPPAAAPAAAPDPLAGRTVWDDVADCESGDWVDGVPQTGTARWDYGLTFDHGDIFEGGLNFHPGTWDAFKDAGMPDHAGHASRAQQIAVGERVLAAQGWGAWPVCSRKLGLR